MSTLRTRASKGSALTWNEVDTNFKRTVAQKTTTYQVLISDNRSVIEGNHATTPFTITLPPVATADNSETGDFEVTITNINAAAVTVDGSGAETIDGSANLVLQQWASATFILDSAQTGWKSVARSNCDAHTGTLSVSGTLDVTGDTTANGTLTTTGTHTANGALTVNGAFTSVGIDDDATQEVLQLGDTAFILRGSGVSQTIRMQASTNTLILAGGDSSADGGSIVMRGSTHSTGPGDLRLVSNNNSFLFWDESVGDLEIFTGTGVKTSALTIDASQNATFAGTTQHDGSVTLGTSGAAAYLYIDGPATGSPLLEFRQNTTPKAFLRYLDAGDIFDIDADGEIQISSANTLALTLDTSQNATFAGNIIGSAGNEIDSGLFAVKATSEDVSSSTTLQDDDDLTLTLAANTTYYVEMFAIFNSASGTPEMKWQFTEPDGTFSGVYTSNKTDESTEGPKGFDETSAPPNVTLDPGEHRIVHARVIANTAGAGGAFKLQWAQAISDATATTCEAGSWIKATKLV